MAKKIEQWVDNEGDACSNELDALCADLWIAERASAPEPEAPVNADVVAAIDALHEYAHRGDKAAEAKTTHLPIRKGCSYRCRDGEVRLCENVDVHGLAYFGGLAAVHVSNGRAFEDGSEQSKYDVLGEVRAPAAGIALPEGVPPELDDWVKRWEWITARVTEDAIEKLGHDDEVRIGTRWITVWGRCAIQGEVVFIYPGGPSLPVEALAAIANEVRYNGC